jgi:hypothetical protein
MKVTSALLLCPVLLTACGRDNSELTPTSQPAAEAFSNIIASEPPEFIVVASLPETLAVLWRTREAAAFRIDDDLEQGDHVLTGDTLFHIDDELEKLEMERLEMELVSADVAVSGGDSSRIAIVDSLSSLLSLLDGTRPFLVGTDGVLLAAVDSGRTHSGDTLALIVVPPESLFTLVPVPGVEVHYWPEWIEDSRLIESSGESAVYSGNVNGATISFQNSWSIPRQVLRETGLLHFVLSAEGDTIPVERFAATENGVVIISDADLDGVELVPWAALRE